MRRTFTILAATAATAAAAWAHPPPPPDPEPPPPHRATFEWSTWIRAAYGSAPAEVTARPRVVGPGGVPATPRDHGWEVALGGDVTVPIGHGGDVRFGPWVELRTSSAPVVGGELQILAMPAKLDLFWYQGQGILAVRAGGNRTLATAALAYGYQAPWDLMRPRPGRTRYQIGVRVVGSYTRAVDDARVWSATLGLETEPVGALRYLLGIRSWY